MNRMLVKVLDKDGGLLEPQYPSDCGYDLKSSVDMVLPPRQQYPTDIPSGTCVKLPKGSWGLIVGRSSTVRKLGVDVHLGIIDENFTGELLACCTNMTDGPIQIQKGMRLAQLIIMKRMPARIKIVNSLPRTDRSNHGFGSTDA